MITNLSYLFHQKSKTAFDARIPGDQSEWPEEWRTIRFKTYPRLKKIPLSQTNITADYFNLHNTRASRRTFDDKNSFTPEQIATLLQYSCGLTSFDVDAEVKRRAHPSAGRRYPIEVYLIALRNTGFLDSGVYHYSVKNHELSVLSKQGFDSNEIQAITKMSEEHSSEVPALLFCMTAVFNRTQQKYGTRGYRQILLEAGHIGQNVYLTSEALGLHCCSFSNCVEPEIEQLLRIDGAYESLVYTIGVG